MRRCYAFAGARASRVSVLLVKPRIACIQLRSGPSPGDNLAAAEALVRLALSSPT
jgi:hypothetical protein